MEGSKRSRRDSFSETYTRKWSGTSTLRPLTTISAVGVSVFSCASVVRSSTKTEACEGVVTRTSRLRPRPLVGGGEFEQCRKGVRPAPGSKFHLLPVISGVSATLVRNSRECHCSAEFH